MADGPTLEVSDDPVAAAAAALTRRLLEHLEEEDTVRLAIPGGSALAALPPARAALGEGWRRVRLTWVDERCVDEDDPESNRGTARRLGVLDAPAPLDVLPLFEDGETPESAVARSARALVERFAGALDVLLLGLGEDGHVASLFPALSSSSRSGEAGAAVAHVQDSPKPPSDRITLTRASLRTAACAVLLATGEGKRAALERLLAGDPSLPAQGLRGLHVVTDQEISA